MSKFIPRSSSDTTFLAASAASSEKEIARKIFSILMI